MFFLRAVLWGRAGVDRDHIIITSSIQEEYITWDPEEVLVAHSTWEDRPVLVECTEFPATRSSGGQEHRGLLALGAGYPRGRLAPREAEEDPCSRDPRSCSSRIWGIPTSSAEGEVDQKAAYMYISIPGVLINSTPAAECPAPRREDLQEDPNNIR